MMLFLLLGYRIGKVDYQSNCDGTDVILNDSDLILIEFGACYHHYQHYAMDLVISEIISSNRL